MSARGIAVDLLLGLGVGAELACALGLLVARDVFDRLHYAAAASTIGPLLLGAAVLVQESVSSAGIETIVTIAFLVLLGPGVTIAIGVALHPPFAGTRLRLGEDKP